MIAPELQTAILASLVQLAADDSALEDLERLGLAPDDIDALRDTRLADLSVLAQHNVIDLRVSRGALARARRALRHSDARGQTITELVRRGASRRMLRELCGLTSREISIYRRALDVDHSANGRVPEPSTELVERVCHLWRDHAAMDELERYIAIDNAVPEAGLRTIHRALQAGGCI